MNRSFIFLLLAIFIFSSDGCKRKEILLVDRIIYSKNAIDYDNSSLEIIPAKYLDSLHEKSPKYVRSCNPYEIIQIQGNQLLYFQRKKSERDSVIGCYSIALNDGDISNLNKYLQKINYESLKNGSPPKFPNFSADMKKDYLILYKGNSSKHIDYYYPIKSPEKARNLINEIYYLVEKNKKQIIDTSLFVKTKKLIKEEIYKDSLLIHSNGYIKWRTKIHDKKRTLNNSLSHKSDAN